MLDEIVGCIATRESSLLRDAEAAQAASSALVNVAEANVQANDGDDDDAVVLSRWNATDKFEGCVIMRCIDTLLKRCDERGFERSAQQLQFHDMFLRACGRVIYKKDWAAHEPEIMKLHNWTRCKSEVAISTPRRFGKTFSVALFVACIALSCPQEICVFSPARRASRKMLERILEFVRLVGGESRLCESNMEQARLRPFNGTGTSLVRSFPSKVSSAPGRQGAWTTRSLFGMQTGSPALVSAPPPHPVDPLVKFWKAIDDEKWLTTTDVFPSDDRYGEMARQLDSGLALLFAKLDSETTRRVIGDFLTVFQMAWQQLKNETIKVGSEWRTGNYNTGKVPQIRGTYKKFYKMDFATLATVVEDFTEFLGTPPLKQDAQRFYTTAMAYMMKRAVDDSLAELFEKGGIENDAKHAYILYLLNHHIGGWLDSGVARGKLLKRVENDITMLERYKKRFGQQPL